MFRVTGRLAIFVSLTAVVLANFTLYAQNASLPSRQVNLAQVRVLPNHRPRWADSANDLGALPADQVVDQMTLVLSGSPEQELAFEKFLADQQNPASTNYHHWLSPAEIGERFGAFSAGYGCIDRMLAIAEAAYQLNRSKSSLYRLGGTAAGVGREPSRPDCILTA